MTSRNNKDLLNIISNQLDEIIGQGVSDKEVEEFFSDLFEDLSVRRAYINGYLSNPQEYLAKGELDSQEIKDGPIIGILITGIFTAFSGGLVLGAIAIAAGLIQYWLRPQNSGKSQEEARKKDPRSVSVFEGSSGGELAKFGETIPAIFTSVSQDPSGGVQTGGKLIYSSIIIRDGQQTLFVRYCLSHGVIGNVDLSKTLLNDQPFSNFSPGSVSLSCSLGTINQVAPSGFNFHSQNISPQNNNISNSHLIDESATILASDPNKIIVSEEEYTLYEVGSDYRFYNEGNTSAPVYFKVLNKSSQVVNSVTSYYIFCNAALPESPTNGKVFKASIIAYRTTKRVTRIDLNFSAEVYGRDNNSKLVSFATLYNFQIKAYGSTNWASVARLYFYSKNASRLLRSISILNLPLGVYDIKISPESFAVPQLTLEMPGSGALNEFNGVASNGIPFTLSLQGYITPLNAAQINANLEQSITRVPQNSCQSGQSLMLRSVNEAEAASKASHVNLPGYCTAEARIKFSEAVSGQITLTWNVSEGIVLRSPRLVGIAETGSAGSVLKYSQGVPSTLDQPAVILRNLDKRKEATIVPTSVGSTTINAVSDIDLEPGDRWLIHQPSSSCYWAEIYASLIDESKYGISNQVIGDYYTDWESIRFAVNWCRGDNEHGQKFAWHGILSQTTDLAAINADECRKSLLQPWRGNGQTGFYPLLTPPVSAIYNDGNSSNLKLEYTTNDQNPVNTVSVVYLQQEHDIQNNAVKFQPITITAQTWQARRGQVSLVIQGIELRNCTSQAQAIKTAQVFLNIARYSSRITSSLDAKTIESMSLQLGHLFRLYTSSTNYDTEQSGVVIEVSSTSSFRLDKEFTLVSSLSATNLPGELFDPNMDFVNARVAVGDLVRNRETGIVSTISGVARQVIQLSPAIPSDTYYEIADMTTNNLVAFIASGNSASLPLGFTVSYSQGHIWYTLINQGSLIVEVGDVVGIGTTSTSQRLFQAVGIDLSVSENAASVNITGANWDKRLYEYTDMCIITRNNVFNEAP